MVLTGGGGIGKSRLTLEIGRLAETHGWAVFRVGATADSETLAHLSEELTPEVRVLLLFDYIETRRGFIEFIEELADVVDRLGLAIRYVANCRTSYYSAISGIDHGRVDLQPEGGAAGRGWLQSYRAEAVRYILRHGGLPLSPRHLEVCGETPAFAVFLCYLQASGRQADLRELVEYGDFPRWVRKRVQTSFPENQKIPRELAQAVTLFPLTEYPAGSFGREFRDLLDVLANDGWVERSEAASRWEVAHDSLADQILLSYLQTIPRTADSFAREVFDRSYGLRCVDSALISFQRRSDADAIRSVDWFRLFKSELARKPDEWKRVRDLLIRTPLLSVRDSIRLLGTNDAVWAGSDSELGFQFHFGWCARQCCRQDAEPLDQDVRSILENWIERSAAGLPPSNYILTSGLRLCPTQVARHALNWIERHPLEHQTHYLLVAWLEEDLPAAAVREAVGVWAATFSQARKLSFLARAWLNLIAKDEDQESRHANRELVRVPIEAWLEHHQKTPEARFVYTSWLDATVREFKKSREFVLPSIRAWIQESENASAEGADHVYRGWLECGGDRELVREPVIQWASKHGTSEEADFLFRAWLERRGHFSFIEQFVFDWLHEHRGDPEAVYLTKAVSARRELPARTVSDILHWCKSYPDDDDALWRLSRLRGNLFNPRGQVPEDVVEASERVLRPWVSPPFPEASTTVQNQVTMVFSFLIGARSLAAGDLRLRVDRLLVASLRNPSSYKGDPSESDTRIQRKDYLNRIKDLIQANALSISADREVPARFLAGSIGGQAGVRLRRKKSWRRSKKPTRIATCGTSCAVLVIGVAIGEPAIRGSVTGIGDGKVRKRKV